MYIYVYIYVFVFDFINYIWLKYIDKFNEKEIFNFSIYLLRIPVSAYVKYQITFYRQF